MTRAKQTGPRLNALASSQQMLAQRLTCEGCAALRTKPRPMCQAEGSPHFRRVREPYHDRCPAFSVNGLTITAPAKDPAPLSRAQIAGEVPRLKRKRSYVTGDVARRLA